MSSLSCWISLMMIHNQKDLKVHQSFLRLVAEPKTKAGRRMMKSRMAKTDQMEETVSKTMMMTNLKEMMIKRTSRKLSNMKTEKLSSFKLKLTLLLLISTSLEIVTTADQLPNLKRSPIWSKKEDLQNQEGLWWTKGKLILRHRTNNLSEQMLSRKSFKLILKSFITSWTSNLRQLRDCILINYRHSKSKMRSSRATITISARKCKLRMF